MLNYFQKKTSQKIVAYKSLPIKQNECIRKQYGKSNNFVDTNLKHVDFKDCERVIIKVSNLIIIACSICNRSTYSFTFVSVDLVA